MDVLVESVGTVRVARVSGEVTTETVESFSEAMQELVVGQGAALAVDLSGLRFVNSDGLAALIHLVTRSRLNGGQVVLFAPSPFVREVLNITRLDTWFDICDSQAEACLRVSGK
ncbi:MAG: STAS domain-containing protein [Planctomycetes bacterium]|nr:STAS domain-containing protein [Planctomycetota bacterium]